MKNKMIKTAISSAILLSAFSSFSFAGFSVSGTQLLDKDGNAFVMRGVNHPHAWYTNRQAAFKDIDKTAGANTVRVVLSDGQQFTKSTAADVANVIKQCKTNNLICVLEVHDVTGSGEKPEAGTLANAAKYWVEIANVLKGEEDYVIINIANEPFGNGIAVSTYVNEHVDAIKALRAAGLTHTLMIDAANWGQDWQEIMLNNADKIAAGDPLSNTMFSVHMYEVYGSAQKIDGYVSQFLNNNNLPLIVGEFGPDHFGQDVDEDAILAVSEKYQIGYLGWSWSGNTGNGTQSLDMTVGFDASQLTPWGERLINGTNGIKATSVKAAIFGDYVPQLDCNWLNSLKPVCTTATDGHTVEDGVECVGVNTCRAQELPYGVIGEPGVQKPTTEPPVDEANCKYMLIDDWGNGFQGKITVSNPGTETLKGWELTLAFTDGSTLKSHWNAVVTGNDPYVVTPLSWNADIPAGGSVSFGFVGDGQGGAAVLGGASCK